MYHKSKQFNILQQRLELGSLWKPMTRLTTFKSLIFHFSTGNLCFALLYGKLQKSTIKLNKTVRINVLQMTQRLKSWDKTQVIKS